ncbi:MAG: hypothetical protein NWQ28_07440, partial [Nodularia sp. (in: cyanobacteria)]|nr:hypothetical protein [Nodularia sp. (in: cyanobacteria)]
MIVLLSLSSLSIVGGSFLLKQAVSSSSKIKVINDTSGYQEIRQQLLSNNNYIQHFPHALPNGAENVRIAYYLGLASEESFFQVRLKQSPE